MQKLIVFVITGVAIILSTAPNLPGGNVRYLGKQPSARLSMNDIDHTAWEQLLVKYVDADGRVNYKAWEADADDTRRLDQYLSHLSDAGRRVSATGEAKLAFWINAYNAVTIRGILSEYPTTSIRNHTARLWGYNIWKHLQVYVDGKPVSLEHIEHEILRKMSEPRIHFAIVCASIGCPRLLNHAYQPDRLETQLDAAAKDFFARRQNFQHDPSRQRFLLSAILNWFGEDFGSSQQALLRRIAPWLPTAAASQAARENSVSVSYLDYDWNLNEL